MKLALYSFVGSAMVLIGLLAAYTTAGSHSTSLIDLAHAGLPVSFQMWCFPLVFTGFAILAGMWPFHTWAPTGHVAAPTAASMLLAGVVMKLGAYGCLRVGIWLFPRGLDPWGFSSPSSASSTAHSLPSRKPTSNSSSATPASATWASFSSAS
jgi:NADH-quinone oxidoreductase subunit M